MHTHYKTFEEKLSVVLSSPALCRVILAECDLFSLGEVNVILNEDILEDDPLYETLNNPNYFQTRRQFLWDYRFWSMIGVAYLFSDTKILENDPTLYWLNVANVEIPQEVVNKLDKLYLSKNSVKKLENEKIIYRYKDGTHTTFRLGDIKPFVDITNGVGNWYSSPSRIDALYKIISNSEKALDAKGINLHFSGKFMVSGKADEANTFEMPLTGAEKKSIEQSTYSNNPVTAVKSLVDVKRYVSDLARLELDKSYESDVLYISSMYGIPKELADSIAKGSTYENQEKALIRHISRTVQPKANDLAAGLQTFFGYDKTEKELTITYDHLPEMQRTKNEEKEAIRKDAETLKTLIDTGVDREDAARFLGMDLKFVENEQDTDITEETQTEQGREDEEGNQEEN